LPRRRGRRPGERADAPVGRRPSLASGAAAARPAGAVPLSRATPSCAG